MADRGTAKSPSLPDDLTTSGSTAGVYVLRGGAALGSANMYVVGAGLAAGAMSGSNHALKTRNFGNATAAIFGPW